MRKSDPCCNIMLCETTGYIHTPNTEGPAADAGKAKFSDRVVLRDIPGFPSGVPPGPTRGSVVQRTLPSLGCPTPVVVCAAGHRPAGARVACPLGAAHPAFPGARGCKCVRTCCVSGAGISAKPPPAIGLPPVLELACPLFDDVDRVRELGAAAIHVPSGG